MARLPVPGADSGSWGSVLNDFLLMEHNGDGSLKASGSLASKADVADLASKYTFPVGGIPRTDLAADVQASLATADAGGGGGGSAPDATVSSKGIIRLAGDLSGTALTPTIAAGAVTGGGGGHIATGTITDANIHASASIAKSKLAPLAVSDSDVAAGASIAQSKISGLATSLAGKANSSHTHPVSDVNGLQAQIDGKAPTVHTHAQVDVIGLATSLAGKADTSHVHTAANITDINQYVSDAIGNKIIAGTNVTVDYDAGTGQTTVSSTAAGTGGTGSTTVDTVAGRTGDVILSAGDITAGTFATARIPNLDATKLTTGTLDIARVPTGTSATTVSFGNHNHDTSYAALAHNHNASDVTTGTFNIARIPTGTSNTTVSLGNHNHDTSYAAIAHIHDDRYYTETEVDASLALKLDANQKGVANGLATLGSDSKIPISQLPALAISETFTAASQAVMLALTAQRGDVCIRTDISKTYILSSDVPSTLTDWKELVSSGTGVTSVNGNTGTVTLTAASVGAAPTTHSHTVSQISDSTTVGRSLVVATDAAAARAAIGAGTSNLALGTTSTTAKAGDYAPTKTDVGLANVDNTSDVSKPVSTATQTALNLKAPLTSPTFTGVVTVPTPTNNTDAATKAYVDAAASSGTPDANTTTKGKIQLAGDLAGTAAAPTVPGLATKAALSHSHTVSEISDSTTVGRSLVVATDAAAARAAIGAGTGSSNLALGTTSTTAKAGDYVPTKADVGLGNVDNTSDVNKPVSSAQLTALNAKAALSHTHTIANVTNLQTTLDAKALDNPYLGYIYVRASGDTTSIPPNPVAGMLILNRLS